MEMSHFFGLGLLLMLAFGGSAFAGTPATGAGGPLNIPASETQIVYQNATMKACVTGKDALGAPNAANFCPNSLIPTAAIPAQGGFGGTAIAEIGFYNAAGDRLDGFFDCKMKRVAAAIPTVANAPDTCVRVRCGYMGSCAGGAPTCAQHQLGAVACQMYSLRSDKPLANVGSMSVTPMPVSQINSGCSVNAGSFDCTTTTGYDPTKTYYITGLDPTTCRPVCVVSSPSPSPTPGPTCGLALKLAVTNQRDMTGGSILATASNNAGNVTMTILPTGGSQTTVSTTVTNFTGLQVPPGGGWKTFSISATDSSCTTTASANVSWQNYCQDLTCASGTKIYFADSTDIPKYLGSGGAMNATDPGGTIHTTCSWIKNNGSPWGSPYVVCGGTAAGSANCTTHTGNTITGLGEATYAVSSADIISFGSIPNACNANGW
jgi:hypothetical protein